MKTNVESSVVSAHLSVKQGERVRFPDSTQIQEMLTKYSNELREIKDLDTKKYGREMLVDSHFNWYVINYLSNPYHVKEIVEAIESSTLDNYLARFESEMYQPDTTMYYFEYWSAAKKMSEELKKKLVCIH